MRVLHLSTYPVEVPRHGGQARVANLVATYAVAGIGSRVVAVYEPEHYGPGTIGSHDVAFPLDSSHRRRDLPFCTDLASGRFAADDPGAWAHVRRQVTEFRPDVVQLEQPWLWPAVARLRREGIGAGFRVVYSSQNVEAPLKRRVLAGGPADLVDRVVAEIEGLEREIARAGDLVIAATAADAAVYRSWGAPHVVVAPNGIVERAVDPALLARWRESLRGLEVALFVGSAYPPNVVGFWETFAPSLAFLAPHQRVLVVGGIAHVLTNHSEYHVWRDVNASRLMLLGPQDEATLAVLLQLAGCIVLPITIGGGSNIKTAEAIFARKPVIGTTTSLRGFEEIVALLPGIHRVDEPAAFRRTVKRALDGLLPLPAHDPPGVRERVLWKATLAALPGELRALVAGPPLAAEPRVRA